MKFLDDVQVVLAIAWRAILWVLIATFIGLSQLVLVLLGAAFIGTVDGWAIADRQIKDGALIFFSLTLTSSITLDWWFKTLRIQLEGDEGILLFAAAPLVIWILATIYVIAALIDVSGDSVGANAGYVWMVMALSLAHACLAKIGEFAEGYSFS